uniref:Reverse transcriptase domain-containing protein n=1 Tax=Cyprinus carpio carpio TaxID=630221 RepID=A0A9J8AEV6_CYPCA
MSLLKRHLCPGFVLLSSVRILVSALSDRKYVVRLGEFLSSTASLPCDLPQGSILSPSLFSLYILPLGSIFRKHGVSLHFYTDDTQIYLPFRKNDTLAMTALLSCLDEVKSWLSQKTLSLNEEKTEVIVFGPSENMKAYLKAYMKGF